jgi:hypothetical protein
LALSHAINSCRFLAGRLFLTLWPLATVMQQNQGFLRLLPLWGASWGAPGEHQFPNIQTQQRSGFKCELRASVSLNGMTRIKGAKPDTFLKADPYASRLEAPANGVINSQIWQ